jgi:hypothetical protein
MRGLGALNANGEKIFSLTYQVVDRTMVCDYIELLVKKEGATRIHMSVNPDTSGTWLVNWTKEDKYA